jgi:hypothetical protein
MAEMKLAQLNVNEDWKNPGAYTGELHFKGQYGSVTIKLTPELSKKILALVAEDMVKATRELATTLTADVLSGATALPAPDDNLEPL